MSSRSSNNHATQSIKKWEKLSHGAPSAIPEPDDGLECTILKASTPCYVQGIKILEEEYYVL